jgi:hypothetical protein
MDDAGGSSILYMSYMAPLQYFVSAFVLGLRVRQP